MSSIILCDLQCRHFPRIRWVSSVSWLNFWTRSFGLVGSFSFDFIFRLFKPFASKEAFLNILHTQIAYGMLVLYDTYSMWNLKKTVCSRECSLFSKSFFKSLFSIWITVCNRKKVTQYLHFLSPSNFQM